MRFRYTLEVLTVIAILCILRIIPVYEFYHERCGIYRF